MIVNLEKFVAEERPGWERLDAILRGLAEDPWRKLPLTEARELERLYQRAAADLARLSTYAAEPAARQYLENLVARVLDLYLDPKAHADKALPVLVAEVERASGDLQCEASLIFPPMELVGFDSVWKGLGYERRTPESLGIQAWTDAALESMPKGSALFFKQLRTDRVLRPI